MSNQEDWNKIGGYPSASAQYPNKTVLICNRCKEGWTVPVGHLCKDLQPKEYIPTDAECDAILGKVEPTDFGGPGMFDSQAYYRALVRAAFSAGVNASY